MSDMEKEVSTENIAEIFSEHLKVENNYRIIFSGKFGVGKTFFLKKFFETRNSEYNSIIISPVNYVINSNEDIFELIKVDIIKELFFSGKLMAKKIKRKTSEKISFFINEKPQHLLKFLTSALKSVNPVFTITDDFYDACLEICKKYKEYEKKLEKELKTSEEELSDFIDSFSDSKGSLFENDFITRTITSSLEYIKGNKKNILIIDDLDRIDPDHIFRILNIFSAHNNYYDTDNKFNFDHIILVCDIENIKKVFHHRYGSEVDFEGYMDKFYSTEIFPFTNKDAIADYVKAEFNLEGSDAYYEFLVFMLHELVENELITLRKLIKHKYNISFNEFTLFKLENYKVQGRWYISRPMWLQSSNFVATSNDLKILTFLRFVNSLYGEFSIFINQLNKLKQSSRSFNVKNFENVIAFLGIQLKISSAQNLDIFLSIGYDQGNYINDVSFPKQRVLSEEVHITPIWNSNNPYTGDLPYFSNVMYTVNTYNKNSEREFQLSQFVVQLEQVISNCYHYNYLKKAGILHTNKNL